MTEEQLSMLRRGKMNMFVSGMNAGLAFMFALMHSSFAFISFGLAVFNYYVAQAAFKQALGEVDEEV